MLEGTVFRQREQSMLGPEAVWGSDVEEGKDVVMVVGGWRQDLEG